MYYALVFPFRMLFKIEKRGKLEWDCKGTLIFASNHPSRIDAFLALLSLTPEEFHSLRTIYFVTQDIYFYKPFLLPFLWMSGCVSTRPRRGKVLPPLAEELREGAMVYIFPEGPKEFRDGHARVGVVWLERAVPDVHIVPVKMSLKNKTLRGVLSRKVSCVVTFRRPFRHRRFPKDLQPLADDVMRKITGAEVSSIRKRKRGSSRHKII